MSGNFSGLGSWGGWWQALSESDALGAYYRYMNTSSATVGEGSDGTNYILSVRCVKD
jgi:hypothetical protein